VSPAEAHSAATDCGRLTLPAGTPYERQLLQQSIRRAVARWGVACVSTGRRAALLVDDSGAGRARCAHCAGNTGPLRCRGPAAGLCLGCALLVALPEGCIAATVARAVTEQPPPADRLPHGIRYRKRAAAAVLSIA
jgi:hypothetical protein